MRNSAAVPTSDFVITDPAQELFPTPFESRYGKYSGDSAPEWNAQESTGSRIVKGAVAGAVAGLAAGFVMVQFQKVWSKAEESQQNKHKDEKNLHKEVPEHREHKPAENEEQNDDATIKAA